MHSGKLVTVGPFDACSGHVVCEAVASAVGVRLALYFYVAEGEMALDKVGPIGVFAQRAAKEGDQLLLAVNNPGVVLAGSLAGYAVGD
jgi:hypothetical protein